MAVDKFFSLGVLTFTIHMISSSVVCAMRYILHIEMHPQAPTCLRHCKLPSLVLSLMYISRG